MNEATHITPAAREALTSRRSRAPTLRAPHWHTKNAMSERIGNEDYMPATDCDSVWLFLRTEDHYPARQEFRFISDVAIYFWFESATSFQVQVKAHNVFSASEHDLNLILKLVKALQAKVPEPHRPSGDKAFWEPYNLYLPRLYSALGVTECVQYAPGQRGDGFAPIHLFVADLLKDIQRRLTRLASMRR